MAFGSKPQLKPTLIVKCPNCQGLMLTSKEQKTKVCPYCGKNVNLQKAQRIAAAKDPFEASEILKQLKSQQGFKKP
jgi:acetyl-CoA carboxylase beta subunit